MADDAALIFLGLDDAEHLTAAEKAERTAGYAAHERDARARGIPMLGQGRVFPIAEELIVVEPMRLPEWFVWLGGMDFGIDHPFAGVRLGWDRDDDVVYVTNEYRVSDQIPVVHAAALKAWGEIMPWAWPHDGLQRDKGSGTALRDQYQLAGLNMLPDRACWDDGSTGVEAGLMAMYERMQTNRWKVFSTCTGWLEEFRTYHRKDGMVVKERDDLISASRYGLMMLRFAKPMRHKAAAYHRAEQAVSSYDEQRW